MVFDSGPAPACSRQGGKEELFNTSAKSNSGISE